MFKSQLLKCIMTFDKIRTLIAMMKAFSMEQILLAKLRILLMNPTGRVIFESLASQVIVGEKQDHLLAKF